MHCFPPRELRSSRPLVAVALLIALLLTVAAFIAPAIRAQEPVRIRIDQVIVEEDGTASALVSVTDAGGQPVQDVSGFETTLDGEAFDAEVATALDEEAGVGVLVLIDISGSMAGEPIAQARDAATQFVSQLAANDSAAIVPFGGDAPAAADFSSDQATLLAEVAGLETEGNRGTALYDSVIAAIDRSEDAPTSRRALILLTDGQDLGTSTSTRDASLDAGGNANVPIYAIGLGDADLDYLSDLADVGRGAFYHAPAPADITSIFEAIGLTLRSQYAIPVPLDGGDGERVLRVELETPEGTIADTTTFTATPAASGSGGGSSALLIVGAAIAVLAIGGLAFLLLRRRRRRGPSYQGGVGGAVPVPRKGAEVLGEPVTSIGVLRVIDGPDAGLTATLSEAATEVGSAASCDLTLSAAGGAVASVHARVWLKGGKLMVHHVARKQKTYVGDQPVEWASLDESDTLRIGPHVIAFSVETASAGMGSPLPQPTS